MQKLERGIILASESGLTDSKYVKERSELIEGAFLGGTNADEKTLDAASEMVSRGRKEFLIKSKNFAKRELQNLQEENIVVGINVRSSSLEPLIELAEILKKYRSVLEINAHCRQPEMIERGCGHSLMRDTERLCRWIEEIKKTTDVRISVKTRAEVVNTRKLAKRIERSGADIIHIDCMDSPEVIDQITQVTDLFTIANNGVRAREDFLNYIDRGADAVSTARGGRNPEMLKKIRNPKQKETKKKIN